VERRQADSFVEHNWTSSGAKRQGRRTTVRHMDLAIYIHALHLQQDITIELLEVTRLGRGQHEFVFDDPNDIVAELQVAFVNDRKVANLMAAQRSLKTIMRERTNEGPNSR